MDDRIRVGVIVPSSNTVVEPDYARALPPPCTLHVARMYLAETTADAERAMLDHALQAAKDLGSLHPAIGVFACTSAGAILGVDGEAELERRIAELLGAPVVSTNAAVAAALCAVKAKRVAVITAYNEELTQAIAGTLTDRGIEVSSAHGMGITDNYAIAKVTPQEIVDFVRENADCSDVDALLVSCTNLRAVEAVPQLRELAGIPVVTSNLAAIAVTLHRLGIANMEETLA